MRVDSHQHAYWHMRDAAGLVADLDENAISYAWLLTWEIPPAEDRQGFHYALNPRHIRPDGTHPGIVLEDQLRARELYPDRFLLGYCPWPQQPAAPKLFEAAVKMHDVQVCGEWKFQMPFDDPRCLELFHCAGELGCPVVLHLDAPYLPSAETGEMTYQPGWYGGTPDTLARALEACTRTTFIGHAPGFWRYISADALERSEPYPMGPVSGEGQIYELFESYPNLYADLSAGSGRKALQRDPEHAERFLARFADRLLFARDDYGPELPEFLETLDLDETIREKIYRANAESLVKPRFTPPER